MELGVLVGGVHQDIRVKDQHLLFPIGAVEGIPIVVEYPVQGVAVGNIHEKPAPVPRRQGLQRLRGVRRGEDAPEASLHKGGHRGPPARCLFLQAPHDRVRDVERRLHMENHTTIEPTL